MANHLGTLTESWEATQKAEPQSRAAGRVLVVDDDTMLREELGTSLSHLGFDNAYSIRWASGA